jgi:hypothetical protein
MGCLHSLCISDAEILKLDATQKWSSVHLLPKTHIYFRSRRWGPRSRVCARETLRSAPHRRELKFSGARVCRVTFVKFPHFPVKIRLFWGVGGHTISLLPPHACNTTHHSKTIITNILKITEAPYYSSSVPPSTVPPCCHGRLNFGTILISVILKFRPNLYLRHYLASTQ